MGRIEIARRGTKLNGYEPMVDLSSKIQWTFSICN